MAVFDIACGVALGIVMVSGAWVVAIVVLMCVGQCVVLAWKVAAALWNKLANF
jgi:hypothetical protein